MSSLLAGVILSSTIMVNTGVSQRSATYESMPACKAAMMEEVQMYTDRETVRHIGNGVVFLAKGVSVRLNCTNQRKQPGQPQPDPADVPQ